MLDPRFIRSNPDTVRRAIELKHERADLDRFLALDEERRRVISEADDWKALRNSVSEKFGRRAKAMAGQAPSGGPAPALAVEEVVPRLGALRPRTAEGAGAGAGADGWAEAVLAEYEDPAQIKSIMRAVGEAIAGHEARLRALEAEQETVAHWIPNVPHESVPEGDASHNRVVKEWGQPAPAGSVLPHWEIAEKLGLMDWERPGKIAGSGFLLFTGLGARLQRALVQFFLDRHTNRNGYREVSPPYMIRPECLFGTGQLPKLEEDMYRLRDDELYLNPTAEVPVTNIYRDEILPAEALPLKLTAYCPSFRREAGAAGRETRGMIRVHQFDKVELVKFVEPSTSYDELERLTADAEGLLESLELPYRRLLLAAGDLSFASAKTYDLEAWAPAEGRWLEVSSCSNFESFQARRMNIRFRREPKGKPEHVHTLNGSGLALPRVFVALLEHHQTPDGRVRIPAALRPYLEGREYLE